MSRWWGRRPGAAGRGDGAEATSTHDKGAAAERRGVGWLRSRGYRILATNLRTAGGELDAVAVDGDTLCFVEIKARATGLYGPAVLAVDLAKQRRLARAARAYLGRSPWEGPCRFDVLGMDRLEGGAPPLTEPPSETPETATADGWRFTLIRDAFRVDG